MVSLYNVIQFEITTGYNMQTWLLWSYAISRHWWISGTRSLPLRCPTGNWISYKSSALCHLCQLKITITQMSTELQGYGAESPENKVSVLQTQADEVLAFAVFSMFLELNLFCKQRKMLCDWILWTTDGKHDAIHTVCSKQYLCRWDKKPFKLKYSDNRSIHAHCAMQTHILLFHIVGSPEILQYCSTTAEQYCSICCFLSTIHMCMKGTCYETCQINKVSCVWVDTFLLACTFRKLRAPLVSWGKWRLS